MQKVYSIIGLILVILVYPVISLFVVYIIGNLVEEPTTWGNVMTTVSFVIFSLIFQKDIKFEESFKTVSIKSFFLVLAITIALYIVAGFIESHSRDLIEAAQDKYSIKRLIFMLGIAPFFEELCYRVIIINRFQQKINNWILVFMTATYFGLAHLGNIYMFFAMFLFGAVMARLYIITGNGSLVVMVHFFYLLITVLLHNFFWGFYSNMLTLFYTPLHIIVSFCLFVFLLFFFIPKTSTIIKTLASP